jgi:hypothetical protein
MAPSTEYFELAHLTLATGTVAGLAPELAPLTSNTGPVRLGPVCMVVTTCTLLRL